MEKKEFKKAEVEEIRFDTNDDIVTTSTVIGPIGGQPVTGGLDDPGF